METENSSNTITYIALFIAIAIVVGGGVYYLVSVGNGDSDSISDESADAGITTENNNMDEAENDNEDTGDEEQMGNTEETDTSETNPGTFSQYSADRVAEAEGDVVLFFAADWCPTCQALIRDIEANTNEIPSDLTILEVDYDDERDLRREYDVVIQHTLVKVDNNGEELDSWVGGNRLETILNRV
jgi:thiol-disulfide isomerase/thioredoxin